LWRCAATRSAARSTDSFKSGPYDIKPPSRTREVIFVERRNTVLARVIVHALAVEDGERVGHQCALTPDLGDPLLGLTSADREPLAPQDLPALVVALDAVSKPRRGFLCSGSSHLPAVAQRFDIARGIGDGGRIRSIAVD
jgi:hypothetical protein